MTDRRVPEGQLRLEWVYGYRGHQCRSNAFFTKRGKIVYFVAGVAVVYDPVANRQAFFFNHTDDIISLAMHPDGELAVSGQQGDDPQILVWNVETLETVSILRGAHKDGVASVAFGGRKSQFVVSIGLEESHTIAVWKWSNGQLLSQAKGSPERVFDFQVYPEDDGMVSCGVKHIRFWSLAGNTLSSKKGIFGKAGEVQTQLCIAFGPNHTTYTGTLNGDIFKWKDNTLIATIPQAHTGAIFSLHQAATGYASGSSDGLVRLWDLEFLPLCIIDLGASSVGYKGLCVRSVCWSGDKVLCGTKQGEIFEVLANDAAKPRVITQGHSEGELWGLATHPTKPMFVTASDDKTVRIWDMEAHEQIGVPLTTPTQARCAAFSNDGKYIAIGLQSGKVLVLKSRGLTKVVEPLEISNDAISDIKFSPKDDFMAVGSGSGSVALISTSHWQPAGLCEGSKSYVTHIDFSADGKYIQANTGAAERLVFSVPAGRLVEDAERIDSIHWQTWTCVLGTQATGIWKRFAQTDDINAIDTSNGMAVTGDDFGKVKLFRFPCTKRSARHRTYTGHAAHVTNVRFSHDKTKLITTGGADHAIFQWRFFPRGTDEPLGYDSHMEELESDGSDVEALDSDVEREAQVTYKRSAVSDADAVQKLRWQAKKMSQGIKRPPGPADGLVLDFVHGYRGFDCRNNLHMLQSGEIVYHVAAVGIKYNPQTKHQSQYISHEDDILCLAVHPDGDHVATGQVGKNPQINIWTASDLKTVAVLKGSHQRGVCAVTFSADGKRLASVGLDDNHMIVVWDWHKGTPLAETRGHKDKIFVIKFHPTNADELVTVGVKHIKFWKQAGGGFTSKRGTFGSKGKLDSMLSVAFANDGSAVTGASNGKLYKWSGSELERTVDGHSGPVFVLDHEVRNMGGAGARSLFISGGKDGTVRIWDENLKPLQTFDVSKSSTGGGHMQLLHDKAVIRSVALTPGGDIVVGTAEGLVVNVDSRGGCTVLVGGHGAGELWGLATHPDKQLFATASDDRMVAVWSAEDHTCVANWLMPKSCRSCAFSTDGSALAIGLADGSLVVMSIDSQKKLFEVKHRKEEIGDMKFSPDGKHLAVASHDNFVDIYNTRTYKRVGVCKGASSYITHVDWDKSGKLIMVNSGAKELLFFEAPRGVRQTISEEAFPHIEWSTWTSVLGKPCEGIWPLHSDVTDVNTSHLTSDGRTLATGDDFGLVKLFKYPVSGKHAKFKQYLGHSAHVTCVRWLKDDTKLVSVGGGDTAIFVWAFSGSSIPQESCRRRSKTRMVNAGGDSDDSDTDDEEDGYDSDLEKEIKIDYDTKIYVAARDAKSSKPKVQSKSSHDMRSKRVRMQPGSSKVRRTTSKTPSSCSGLKLEFVHGYRGYDTRDNLFYTVDGHLVYHAAALGIVFDTQKQSQRFYNEHNDDIISLAINEAPTSPKLAEAALVATGQVGKVPTIRIWDTRHAKTVSVLRGFHKRGVCSLSFSPNGRLLASVGLDEDHSIAVYRWADGHLLASHRGSHHRIFVVKFHPDNDHEFVTCGIKHVKFWTVAGNQLLARRGIVGPDLKLPTMLSVAFGPNNTTFTGSRTGDIYCWQDNQLSRIVTSSDGAHAGPVFSMYTLIEGGAVSSILSAGKDGVIKIWDSHVTRAKSLQKLPGHSVIRSVVMSKSHKTIAVGLSDGSVYEMSAAGSNIRRLVGGHGQGELWGLAPHPSKDIVVTGGLDKAICVWDVRKREILQRTTVDAGVRSVSFSPDARLIAAGMENGSVVVVDAQNLQEVKRLRDRSSTIQTIKFSPCNRYLAVGCDEGCIDFYSVEQDFRRISYLKSLANFVYHLDWSTDSKFVQFATGAGEIVRMSAPDAKIVKAPGNDLCTWSSWSNLLDESTVGVWPKNVDKGHVNCIAVNHNGTKAVTGDDFGYVKLFDFPATAPLAKFKKYEGHSAHVTNAVFTMDDDFVVTTGGDDSCVMVWRT